VDIAGCGPILTCGSVTERLDIDWDKGRVGFAYLDNSVLHELNWVGVFKLCTNTTNEEVAADDERGSRGV